MEEKLKIESTNEQIKDGKWYRKTSFGEHVVQESFTGLNHRTEGQLD